MHIANVCFATVTAVSTIISLRARGGTALERISALVAIAACLGLWNTMK